MDSVVRPHQPIRCVLAAWHFVNLDSAVCLQPFIPDYTRVVSKRLVAAFFIAVENADRFLSAARDSVINLPLPQPRIGLLHVLRRHRSSMADGPDANGAAFDDFDFHPASSAGGVDWSRPARHGSHLHAVTTNAPRR